MRIDLHRHLGGCISSSFVYKTLQEQNMEQSMDHIRASMTFTNGDVCTFANFLRKFDILNKIHWNETAVKNSIKQVYWDLLGDKIDYSEMHFTIGKYIECGWDPKDIILFIRREFDKHEDLWGNEVGLVFSLKYESNRDEQIELSNLILDKDITDAVIGINLVGDEAYFDADFYKPIFDKWRDAGKGLVAHVGESQSVENVRSAIFDLKVDRIAHGIRIIEDPELMSAALERNICFDVAPTSNIITGVVPRMSDHPVLKMIDYGLNVTIGTDDPVQCNTDLDTEYKLLMDVGVSSEKIMEIMNNSVEFSFKNIRQK